MIVYRSVGSTEAWMFFREFSANITTSFVIITGFDFELDYYFFLEESTGVTSFLDALVLLTLLLSASSCYIDYLER